MSGPLYWTARVCLIAAWAALALIAWRRGARGVALLALVFASLRAWPWNFAVLNLGRSGLRALGVYDERIVPKVALAVLVVALVGLALWRRARSATPGPRLGWPLFAALLLQGLLLLSETISLDDFLPRWLMAQPGRYLYEGSTAATALCGMLAQEYRCR